MINLNKGTIVFLLSLLLNIGLLFYIFRGDKESGSVSDNEQEIKSLEIKIKDLEEQRIHLQVEKDSLIQLSDSLSKRVISSKIKTIKIIENRNKRNIVIRNMPDNDLLRVFTKFDSLNNRSR